MALLRLYSRPFSRSCTATAPGPRPRLCPACGCSSCRLCIDLAASPRPGPAHHRVLSRPRPSVYHYQLLEASRAAFHFCLQSCQVRPKAGFLTAYTRPSHLALTALDSKVCSGRKFQLSLREGQASRHANVSDGLRVQQAMTRRAAAAEIAGIATFDILQKWHTYLLNTLTQQPPQGFTPVALEQLTAADKELWMAVSHKVGASLPGDEDFPVDRAIEELMLTPPVAMQLLPRPSRAFPERSNRQGPSKGQPKGRGKSPAKCKGRGKPQPSFPAPLQGKGLKGRNEQGELLCWNYNMERPCQKKPCQLKHQCMKCFGPHPYTCAQSCDPSTSQPIPLMPWLAVSVSAVPLQGPFCQHHPFPSQPAVSSSPFTTNSVPAAGRHAPVRPTTSPSEVSQAPVPAGAAQRFSSQGPCAF